MRYFKEIQNDALIIGTGFGGEEITESEYNALKAEFAEKRALTDKLWKGEITIADVPAEWHEEIQARVDKRPPKLDKATVADYKNALKELGVII